MFFFNFSIFLWFFIAPRFLYHYISVYIFRKNFNFDNLAERSVATNYHFVLKEYFKIEDELQKTRAEAADKRQSMDQQWKELEEKELELRNTFIKFDEVI